MVKKLSIYIERMAPIFFFFFPGEMSCEILLPSFPNTDFNSSKPEQVA